MRCYCIDFWQERTYNITEKDAPGNWRIRKGYPFVMVMRRNFHA